MPSKFKQKFGPYAKDLLIAHQNTCGGCALIWGDAEEMCSIKLDGYSTYVLPAGSECVVRHRRTKKGRCRMSIRAAFRPVAESKKQESTPDPPPPPPPQQICLCEDGQRTCPAGTEPDCSDMGRCSTLIKTMD